MALGLIDPVVGDICGKVPFRMAIGGRLPADTGLDVMVIDWDAPRLNERNILPGGAWPDALRRCGLGPLVLTRGAV